MSDSFILTNCKDTSILPYHLTRFYPDHCVKSHAFGDFHIGIRRCDETVDIQYENDFITIGTITNLASLKKILLNFYSHSLLFNQAKTVSLLFRHFGESAINLLEGSFVIIQIVSENEIVVYVDPMASIPVYYCIDKNKRLWLTSEIKSLFGIAEIDFTLKSLSSLYNGKVLINPLASPFEKISKLWGKCQLTIIINANQYEFKTSSQQSFHAENELDFSEQFAETILDQLLNESVSDVISPDEMVAVPLSGGVDSSLISVLAKKLTSNLHTVCVGTEWGNEFHFAKKVSDHIGSTHHEILLPAKEFEKALVHTIFYNELFDPVSIEIQLPFYSLFKFIKQFTNKVITGYGADMLFAGHYQTDADLSILNRSLYESLLKIQSRGDYAPFAASANGVMAYHPFCSAKLLMFGMNLKPDLKIRSNKIKYILRELAFKLNYLPAEICYREKIAIEVAASLNIYFSDYLCLTGNAYEKKNIFTYDIYKDLFQNQISPEQITVQTYREKFFSRIAEIA